MENETAQKTESLATLLKASDETRKFFAHGHLPGKTWDCILNDVIAQGDKASLALVLARIPASVEAFHLNRSMYIKGDASATLRLFLDWLRARKPGALQISDFQCTDLEAEAVADGLTGNPGLRELRLKWCDLGSKHSERVFTAILCAPLLEKLFLESNPLAGMNADLQFMRFARAFKRTQETVSPAELAPLSVLELECIGWTTSVAKDIAEGLAANHSISSLSVRISKGREDDFDECWELLFRSLGGKPIRVLKINGHIFETRATAAMTDTLHTLHDLREIDFRCALDYSASLVALGAALTRVEKLTLQPKGSDSAWELFLKGLAASGQIQKLEWRELEAKHQCFDLIAEWLEMSHQIPQLGFDKIPVKDLPRLLRSVARNPCIKRIVLKGCDPVHAEVLSRLRSLQSIRIKVNNWNAAEWQAVVGRDPELAALVHFSA